MTYKELSKYHENDIFIFRKGKDVTINTQKILVDWYNRIPKSKRFKIKYVQRIPLTLRIFKLLCESPYIDKSNSFEKTLLIVRGASMVCHMRTIKYVDEAQDFIRDWLNQESMDVHTLLNEFLEKPF